MRFGSEFDLFYEETRTFPKSLNLFNFFFFSSLSRISSKIFNDKWISWQKKKKIIFSFWNERKALEMKIDCQNHVSLFQLIDAIHEVFGMLTMYVQLTEEKEVRRLARLAG